MESFIRIDESLVNQIDGKPKRQKQRTITPLLIFGQPFHGQIEPPEDTPQQSAGQHSTSQKTPQDTQISKSPLIGGLPTLKENVAGPGGIASKHIDMYEREDRKTALVEGMLGEAQQKSQKYEIQRQKVCKQFCRLGQHRQYCQQEMLHMLLCYQQNSDDVIQCGDAVDAYTACASNIQAQSVPA